MRNAFAALLLVLALAAAFPAAAFDGASEARYQALLAAAKANQPVDWTALRFAYADSAEFDLSGDRTDVARKAMFAAINAGDFKAALVQAKLILDQDYVDIDAHVAADLVYQHLGDAASAKREHDVALALLRSIHTGDGATPKTAFTVIDVSEEYSMMRAFDLTVNNQALIQADGHSYDRLNTTDGDGKTHVFFFLIDRIIAAQGAAVKAP